MGILGERLAPAIDTDARASLVSDNRTPAIVVVEDGSYLSNAIQEMCDFLGVDVEHLDSECDLRPILSELRPMAVLAAIDAAGQDGCHVLKTVAAHDPSLPVLLLVGNNPSLAGAADAVEELWGLSSVTKMPTLPAPGGLVEFLCHAGQTGHCLRLMPA